MPDVESAETVVPEQDTTQMVPKMEGSPTEHIKMEHQVPQSANPNTSLSSGPESLIGVPSGSTGTPQAKIKKYKNIRLL